MYNYFRLVGTALLLLILLSPGKHFVWSRNQKLRLVYESQVEPGYECVFKSDLILRNVNLFYNDKAI